MAELIAKIVLAPEMQHHVDNTHTEYDHGADPSQHGLVVAASEKEKHRGRNTTLQSSY
jgi:hypothetical protein